MHPVYPFFDDWKAHVDMSSSTTDRTRKRDSEQLKPSKQQRNRARRCSDQADEAEIAGQVQPQLTISRKKPKKKRKKSKKGLEKETHVTQATAVVVPRHQSPRDSKSQRTGTIKDQQLESALVDEGKASKKDVFQYGNYSRYYGYRAPGLWLLGCMNDKLDELGLTIIRR